MFKISLVTFIFGLLGSCIPTSNTVTNNDTCSPTEQFNAVTRQCETLVNQVPIPTLTTETIYEDSGANTVTLSYYDADNEPATACQVLTYGFGINLFPPTPCTCTSGICSVPVTPNADYFGSTFFTYRVLDSDGFSDAQSVGVTVISVNDAPVPAAADSFSVAENAGFYPESVTLASDNDTGDYLTYSILTTPSYGSISFGINGSFTYFPYDDDTTHTNQIEVLTYQVCDNGTPIKCATSTLNIDVLPINNAPVTSSNPGNVITLEDIAVAITVPVATDTEGDVILYLVSNNPANGVLSSCLDTDGVTSGTRTCTYTPNADFDSSDSFTYQVCDDYDSDGFADDCSGNITVNISMTPVNDAPTALNATYLPNEDIILITDLTANDVDDDNATLVYSIVSQPSNGTVTLSGTQFTFTPDADVNGVDSFTFQACDDEDACSAVGTITVNITAVEDAPTIILPSPYTGSNPTVSMNEGGSFNLLGIKVDEGGSTDEDSQTLEIAIVVSDYGTTDYTQILPANDPTSNTHLSVSYGGSEVGAPYPFGSGNYVSLGDLLTSGNSLDLDLTLTPVAGQSGTIQVEIFLRETNGAILTIVSQTFLFEVNAVTALHGGWSHIKAVGVKKDIGGNVVSVLRDASGNSSTDPVTGDFVKRDHPQVELEWNAFTLASSDSSVVTTDSWEIFRREGDQEYDWDDPIATTSSTIRKYIDPLDNNLGKADPTAGTVYYYTVRPVASTNLLPVPTQEVFSEVRVIAPPDNMIFVHRWMANQEVCAKMHMTMTNSLIDPTDNFSCSFTGPGDTSGIYDIGSDLLVDIAEAGCPYDYVGIGTPSDAGLGAIGEIYYHRGTADCYLKDNTDSWQKMSADSTYLLPNAVAFIDAAVADYSRLVGQPPLVNITSSNAADICESRNGVVITEGGAPWGGLGSYLPGRKFQIAYSAWSSSILDATITETEMGSSLNVSSKCNSSSANGIDSGFTDTASINPNDNYYYSIPGTIDSGIRSIYTGSDELGSNKFTYICESRYGVQDVYGNVSEWVSDIMDCSTQYQCLAANRVGSTILAPDPILPASDWDSYSNTQGLGIASSGRGSCVDQDSDNICDGYLTGWSFFNKSNNSLNFSFPMGLTYSGNYDDTGNDDYMLIGSSAGITTGQLHNDYVEYNMVENYNSGVASAIATGGSYLSGTKAGRYFMEVTPQNDALATSIFGDLTITVIDPGEDGNDYYIELVDLETVDKTDLILPDDPIVSIDGDKITVEIDSTPIFGTKYSEIVTAINLEPTVNTLITAIMTLPVAPTTSALVTAGDVIYTAFEDGPGTNDIRIILADNVTDDIDSTTSTASITTGWLGNSYVIEMEINQEVAGTRPADIVAALSAELWPNGDDIVIAAPALGVSGTSYLIANDLVISANTTYNLGQYDGAGGDVITIKATGSLADDIIINGNHIDFEFTAAAPTAQELYDLWYFDVGSSDVQDMIDIQLVNGLTILTASTTATVTLANGANGELQTTGTINLSTGTGSEVATTGVRYFSGGFNAKRKDIGFRCVIPVESSNYTDTNHNYSY